MRTNRRQGPVGSVLTTATGTLALSTRRLRRVRVITVLIMMQVAQVGFWASLAPDSFARDFPGFGMHWTVWTGSVDDHFVRDVGFLHLALLVVAVQTFRRPGWGRVLGLVWTVFAVPHLLYHATHRMGLSGLAVVTSLTALTVSAVAGVVLILVSPDVDDCR